MPFQCRLYKQQNTHSLFRIFDFLEIVVHDLGLTLCFIFYVLFQWDFPLCLQIGPRSDSCLEWSADILIVHELLSQYSPASESTWRRIHHRFASAWPWILFFFVTVQLVNITTAFVCSGSDVLSGGKSTVKTISS